MLINLNSSNKVTNRRYTHASREEERERVPGAGLGGSYAMEAIEPGLADGRIRGYVIDLVLLPCILGGGQW